MKDEISTLIVFLSDKLIGDRLGVNQRGEFGNALTRILFEKYQGHWYPHNPLFGSGYRAVQIINGRVDRELESAFIAAGVSPRELSILQQSIPEDFSLYCDPGDVGVRLGADGSVWSLDMAAGDELDQIDLNMMSGPAGVNGPTTPQRPTIASSNTTPVGKEPGMNNVWAQGPTTPVGVQLQYSNPMAVTPGPQTPSKRSGALSIRPPPINPMAITPAKPGAPTVTPKKSALNVEDEYHLSRKPRVVRIGSLTDISNMGECR